MGPDQLQGSRFGFEGASMEELKMADGDGEAAGGTAESSS